MLLLLMMLLLLLLPLPLLLPLWLLLLPLWSRVMLGDGAGQETVSTLWSPLICGSSEMGASAK